MKALVIYKLSKWELDILKYDSQDTVYKVHEKQNNNYEKVLLNHKRERNNLETLQKAFPNFTFILRKELPYMNVQSFELIISFGGDNHFVHVSHFIQNLPILGINSNIHKSKGALLSFNTEKFIEIFTNIQKETLFVQKLSAYQAQKSKQKQVSNQNEQLAPLRRLEIVPWTRIEGEIIYPDDREPLKIKDCTCEIHIHNESQNHVSRFLIRQQIPKQKHGWENIICSGYLLSTGAGSTGWYKNCTASKRLESFEPSANFFKGIVREYEQDDATSILQNPTIHQNESLEFISQMNGQITVDAEKNYQYDFPPGAKAIFKIASNHLKVVSNKSNEEKE